MEQPENKIVIVTGPESTGKTILTLGLAAHYKVSYIEEYARKYIENLNTKYTYSDIEHIACWQRDALENARKGNANKLWIADTYLIITKIWFLWVYGKYPQWIDPEIARTTHCLYLLCAPDIAWEPDPLRENGGENRLKLFEAYRHELESFRLDYRIVTGVEEERFINALNFTEQYLK
ncbi:MAG: ATP-binding protein [Bacteroidota bacterium]|nr:MAG: ATP-binding protein [Bacteroidota bacterium]